MKNVYTSHYNYINTSAVESVVPGFPTAFYNELAQEMLVEDPSGGFVERDDVDLIQVAGRISQKFPEF